DFSRLGSSFYTGLRCLSQSKQIETQDRYPSDKQIEYDRKSNGHDYAGNEDYRLMVDTESQQHNPTPSGEKYMEKKYRIGETSDEYKKCILHRNLKKEERCRESYGHAEQTVFFLVRSVAEPNSLLNGDPGEEEEERNEHRAFAEEMLWESVD